MEEDTAVSNKRIRAMSLVEVMTSSVVLSVAIAGLMGSYLSCNSMVSVAREHKLAANALRENGEALFDVASGPFVDPVNGFTYNDIDAVIRKYTTIDPETGMPRSFFNAEELGRPLDPTALLTVWAAKTEAFPFISAFDIPDESCVGFVTVYLNEKRVPLEISGNDAEAVVIGGRNFAPMDLNGDGDTDDTFYGDVDGRYECDLLPVEVEIRWRTRGELGTERIFVLMARKI